MIDMKNKKNYVVKNMLCMIGMVSAVLILVLCQKKESYATPIEASFATIHNIEGKEVSNLSTVLDFSRCRISNYELFVEQMALFPYLTRVELYNSNLTNQQMEGLMQRYPNVKFVWTINLANYWKVKTDQVAFTTNKGDGPNLRNADVAQLKYCTDMVALDIGHNWVSDISFVEYMPNLRILILVDNWISDLSPIAKCKDLVYLETFVNPIKDVSALTNLVNLIDINISYNRFTDITPILNKPRVERLFVTHCGLTREQLKQLEEEYPNAQIEYTVKQSIDAGWRKVDRYKAMRQMFKTNTVSELFMTDVDRIAYYQDVFDAEYYAMRYPEVVLQVGNDPIDLLYYFLDTGIAQGHQACEQFWIVEYQLARADLYASYGSDLNKYFMNYIGTSER